MRKQEEAALALFAASCERGHDDILLAGAPALIASGGLTVGICTLVNLGVCVAELDCDVSFHLRFEANGVNATDCTHNTGLAVSYMSDGTNINGCLPRDDLWREWSQVGWHELGQILHGQPRVR